MSIFDRDRKMTVNQAINASRTQKNAVLLDIRPHDEYRDGHVSGAINIPFEELRKLAPQKIPDKETAVYVVGAYQHRPCFSVKILKQMGYKNVIASSFMEEHHGLLAH